MAEPGASEQGGGKEKHSVRADKFFHAVVGQLDKLRSSGFDITVDPPGVDPYLALDGLDLKDTFSTKEIQDIRNQAERQRDLNRQGSTVRVHVGHDDKEQLEELVARLTMQAREPEYRVSSVKTYKIETPRRGMLRGILGPKPEDDKLFQGGADYTFT